jgi:hypothetical protein
MLLERDLPPLRTACSSALRLLEENEKKDPAHG